MPTKKSDSKNTKKYPTKIENVPVTQKMLYGVRDELKSDVSTLRYEMKSEFSEMRSQMHRMSVLIEEQSARNSIVFDGLTSLFGRQDRLEAEVRDLQGSVVRIK